MLTIKNSAVHWLAFASCFCAAAILTGCAPAGTRALHEGDRLFREGKYSAAIPHFKAAIPQLPEAAEARAWNYLGLAHHHSGQPLEAMFAYRQALQRDPNLAAARFNLGCAAMEQSQWEIALSQFTAFTLLQPQSPVGWVKLGGAQLRAQEFAAAETSFQTALKLNPHLPEAHNGLGVAQLQQRRLRDSFISFTSALQRDPQYGPALLNLGIVYQQHLTNAPVALEKYRQYLSLNPPPANAPAVEYLARQIERQLAPPPNTSEPPSQDAARIAQKGPANLTPEKSAEGAGRPLRSDSSSPPQPAPNETRVAQLGGTQPQASPRRPESEIAEAKPPPDSPTGDMVQSPSPSRPSERPLAENQEIPTPSQEPAEPAESAAESTEAGRPELADNSSVPTTRTTPGNTPEPDEMAKYRAQRPPGEGNDRRNWGDRLNPRGWFAKREDGQGDLESPGADQPPAPNVVMQREERRESQVVHPSRPSSNPATPARSFQRYSYRSPAPPLAGDRRRAEFHFSEGLRAHEERRLVAAMSAYEKALQRDPSYFEAHYNLGLAAFELRDYEKSLAAYEQALAIQPGSFEARYNFALALQRANYLQDAAQELERTVRDFPHQARARATLGKLYAERLDRPDLAKPHYQKVLELDPRHPDAMAIRYWLAARP